MDKRRRKKSKDLLFLFLLVFLCAIAAISFFMILSQFFEAKREQEAFEELSNIIPYHYIDEESATDKGDLPLKNPDNATENGDSPVNPYAELAQRNPDFAAWLQMPGTNVNYPVMFTPDKPEYYLRRAFDRSASISGTPFIGADASLDSDCFIIYGHKMKNGSMFGTLEYYTGPEFWSQQKYFTLDTVDEQRIYEIFAVVKTKILAADTLDFQYYRYTGALSDSKFSELTEWLRGQSLYDTKINPVYGEQILILSTCSYHTENGRLIVAARKVK
ncbi:MAG: class B sortase [Evtepia sp.]|uniref:class B sortase n=1 Tax=Evtepia sp. TaxID=2773933 RepID=UPI002A74B5F4|nr:class B sortase [Evtepia sp.]MDY3014606.1 class B sortase [Evtepia sp.]